MTRLLALAAIGAALMTVAMVAWLTRQCGRPYQSAPARATSWAADGDWAAVRAALGEDPEDGVQPPWASAVPVAPQDVVFHAYSQSLTWTGVVAWEAETWPHPLAHD